jgi:hypothetical protein
MNALHPRDVSEAGFYWYLDTLGSVPQVVEVFGDDVLTVRFAGRGDEDAVADLAGSLVGPLRPPGAQRALSETEQKAVQAALHQRSGRVPVVVKDPGEGHPS